MSIKLRNALPAFLALTCMGAFAQDDAAGAAAGAEGDAVTEEGQAGNTTQDIAPPAAASNEALLEGRTPQQVEEAQTAAAQAEAEARQQAAVPGTLTPSSQEFGAADQDGNGLLSVDEANAAFPDISFEDSNGDTLLNQVEADAAVDGLSLTVAGAGQHSVIGEYGFMEILRATGAIPSAAAPEEALDGEEEGAEQPVADTAQATPAARGDEDV